MSGSKECLGRLLRDLAIVLRGSRTRKLGCRGHLGRLRSADLGRKTGMAVGGLQKGHDRVQGC